MSSLHDMISSMVALLMSAAFSHFGATEAPRHPPAPAAHHALAGRATTAAQKPAIAPESRPATDDRQLAAAPDTTDDDDAQPAPVVASPMPSGHHMMRAMAPAPNAPPVYIRRHMPRP